MTARLPIPEALRLPANPGAGYLAHQAEIDAAVRRVMASGRYLMGEETAAFEAEFARYHEIPEAITTGNGTDALELALRTLGVGPGDAVATVSHTAVATVAAIDRAGAVPVLVDVDPVTFTMDPAHLAEALAGPDGGKVRAVIPVHLYGHPADMGAIQEIAARYELPIIEDCAQAHGALWQGRKVGTFGTFGAFSFYPTKNLGALGDGGALLTSDPRLAERARCLKQYGWRERYSSHLAGINTRLDELQAAVLRVKLPYLDRENARRRSLATAYRAALTGTPLELPEERSGAEHVYHQFVVRSGSRDALRAHLLDRGIGCSILYPEPVHRQPGYRDRVVPGPGGLRHTEALCRRILSLPLHPALAASDVQLAGEVILDWHLREERS